MRSISVVIPVYNEEGNIKQLYSELTDALKGFDYELIFINDGSTDSTQAELEKIAKLDSKVVVVEFRRNFGQTAAIQCGFDLATKELVCTIDGDCQNDPRDIPEMVKRLSSGYDMVTGWRKNRKDNTLIRTLPSRIAALLISLATGIKLHDFGSPLKVMRSEVAKQIKLYGEMHRFIPVIAATVGCKILEVPVNHRTRVAGKSKYGISRTFRVILDMVLLKFLLSFSKRPLHFFGYTGLLFLTVGLLGLLKVIFERFFLGQPAGDRPLLVLGVMFVVLGVQFVFSGIIAEMIARTYHESQGKPTYVIRSITGSRSDLKAAGNINP